MPPIPTTEVSYQTTPFVPGRQGLDWRSAADQLHAEGALLRINTVQQRLGEQRARPGQTSLITGLTSAHSMARLNLPASASFMRFWGGGTQWWRGNTQGTLASIDTGYSGNPLTLLPYRPGLSGEPWMIAADSSRVRQAAATGSVIPLGLAAPGAAVGAAIGALLTTSIAAFDASDSTQAASWTMTAGVDRSTPPAAAAAPAAADVTGLSGNAVQFTTSVGAAVTGYASIVSIAKTMNLNVLQGGAVMASDADLVHMWIRVAQPRFLEEIRIYFVCSAAFTAGVVPGTSATQNLDAFVKAVRPSDVTEFLEDLESGLSGNQQARDATLLTNFVESPPVPGNLARYDGDAWVPPIPDASGSSGLPQQGSAELQPGRTWSELGVIDRPVRRGDFLRIGTTAGRGWDTITGILLVVQMTAPVSGLQVSCDDWFLYGGAGPDTTEPTAAPYDWRVTNYHLDTGAESNPSPIMATTAWLEVARSPVTLTPVAYGSARVRQRFYRRGGLLGNDWFYLGTNASDGGVFSDTTNDQTAVASGTLALDNDEPVTTMDSTGATVLAQPLPVFFGPLGEQLFALGDPKRPGHLYWSKRGKPGNWPPGNVREVTAPSEPLMVGTTFGGVGLIFSNLRGFLVTPDGAGGEPSVDESGCQVGAASRWAWTQDDHGVYFIAADGTDPGVYATTGQRAEWLSEAIDPIFRGQSVVCTPADTILPVDWAQRTAIRLGVYNRVLWLMYLDTGGTRRTLLRDMGTAEWYEYRFAVPPQCAYAEPDLAAASTLLLGATTGVVYTHSGTSDAGTPIACRICTGYNDFGLPREAKDLGDVMLDADVVAGAGAALTLVTRLDNGQTVNAPVSVTGLAGRRRYLLDPFGTTPQQALNLQLDLSWIASAASASAVYRAGASRVVLPETSQLRATEWEKAGTLTDKAIKGVLLEVDTFGVTTTVLVEADGVTVATLTVNHNGRRVAHYGFPSQVGRLVRLRPTTATPSTLYDVQWVFDEEPLQLTHWETQQIDHGVGGWQSAFAADITYRAGSGVTLTVRMYNEGGALVNTRAYSLPGTGGAKQQHYVPFEPDKGVLFQYQFTVASGAAGFWLYREESRVLILPWGSASPLWVRPFGSDDLDRVRQMGHAAGQAAIPNPGAFQPQGDGRLGPQGGQGGG